MPTRGLHHLCAILLFFSFLTTSVSFAANPDDPPPEDTGAATPPPSSPPNTAPAAKPAQKIQKPRSKYDGERRQYMTDHPERSDAGVFHVAFAAGANFYIEPKVEQISGAPVGDYFKDFGFQGGVYFDYDYSELADNIPLMLRGMVGYKYILNSVHVFTFDGVARRQFRFSENATFGVGAGGSAAVWFRPSSDVAATEEVIFLPSFIVNAGFEFNPFMVDFKMLINRFGQDSTILGFELYFGVRL